MFSSRFNVNKNEYRARAGRQGLRVHPYVENDIREFVTEDIRRIWASIESMSRGVWDEKEYAYFVSAPLIRACIDSLKIVKVASYVEARAMGILDKYIRYHETGIHYRTYEFPDDYLVYLDECCLMSYEHAQSKNQIPEYFSGVGIFPLCVSDKDRKYCGDYDDYIYNLSDIEYFKLLGEYRKKVPAKIQQYDSPISFIDTALDQIEKYIEIVRHLEEPIYIPGDGVGAGSYVCRMLKKKYFSSEPNKIGREARLMGLITSDRPCCVLDTKGCNTIFMANMINFLDKDILQFIMDEKKKVCIWDEQPYLKGTWYNGGDIRLWFNYPVEPILPEMKLRYPRVMIGLAEKYNMIGGDNLSKAALKKLGRKKMRDKSPLLVVTHPTLGQASYCFLTRSFSFDTKNAHNGQVKDFLSDMIDWVDDQMIIVDGYCGTPTTRKYEDTVVRNPKYDGEIIKVRENKPGRKRYVIMGTARYKITYMGYDERTKESSYILNSDFCFRKKFEVTELEIT